MLVMHTKVPHIKVNHNKYINDCFAGALKKTPVGKEATHHQFADVVKKWLRFAPFRQGGSGRRQHYKPPVEFMCHHNNTEG